MPTILPLESQDFDRLFEIEQAAHSVPWSLGTLKNNQGERYHNLKLISYFKPSLNNCNKKALQHYGWKYANPIKKPVGYMSVWALMKWTSVKITTLRLTANGKMPL